MLKISLGWSCNLAIETLESNGTSHGNEVRSLVGVSRWDRCPISERDGVVPNTNSSTKFGNLAIVQESSNDVRKLVSGTVGESAIDARTLSKETNKAVGKWQHHLRWEIGTRAHAVVISEILGVLVLGELNVGEDTAPRRKFTGDLRLETTEIRHD